MAPSFVMVLNRFLAHDSNFLTSGAYFARPLEGDSAEEHQQHRYIAEKTTCACEIRSDFPLHVLSDDPLLGMFIRLFGIRG